MLIFKDISANWLNGMDDGWQAVVSGEEMEKLFFGWWWGDLCTSNPADLDTHSLRTFFINSQKQACLQQPKEK